MNIGDPGECYFCRAEPRRDVGSSVFGVSVPCCEVCGESFAGLLLTLEARIPSASSETPEGDAERLADYKAATDALEQKACAAIEDLLGIPNDDPVLRLFVATISSMATAETMARLIELGRA